MHACFAFVVVGGRSFFFVKYCARLAVFRFVHGVYYISPFRKIDFFLLFRSEEFPVFGFSYVWRFLAYFAVVFCSTSIYDNITYGLEKGEFSEEDVYTAAKQACAHDFITDFAGENLRRYLSV